MPQTDTDVVLHDTGGTHCYKLFNAAASVAHRCQLARQHQKHPNHTNQTSPILQQPIDHHCNLRGLMQAVFCSPTSNELAAHHHHPLHFPQASQITWPIFSTQRACTVKSHVSNQKQPGANEQQAMCSQLCKVCSSYAPSCSHSCSHTCLLHKLLTNCFFDAAISLTCASGLPSKKSHVNVQLLQQTLPLSLLLCCSYAL